VFLFRSHPASSYEGPLYRARTNDGREVDVYPGERTDGIVLRYYDQSGNGNHLVSGHGRGPHALPPVGYR
jgi:hypothetical protein